MAVQADGVEIGYQPPLGVRGVEIGYQPALGVLGMEVVVDPNPTQYQPTLWIAAAAGGGAGPTTPTNWEDL